MLQRLTINSPCFCNRSIVLEYLPPKLSILPIRPEPACTILCALLIVAADPPVVLWSPRPTNSSFYANIFNKFLRFQLYRCPL